MEAQVVVMLNSGRLCTPCHVDDDPYVILDAKKKGCRRGDHVRGAPARYSALLHGEARLAEEVALLHDLRGVDVRSHVGCRLPRHRRAQDGQAAGETTQRHKSGLKPAETSAELRR